jgi:hypothetical protein
VVNDLEWSFVLSRQTSAAIFDATSLCRRCAAMAALALKQEAERGTPPHHHGGRRAAIHAFPRYQHRQAWMVGLRPP